MCGIMAFCDVDDKVSSALLERGLDALKHRGPDCTGVYNDTAVFLGHQRLKIIDLSDNANQPMFSEDERYGIVFNGEIYNYRELRSQLEVQGCRFKTQSDTEVLLYIFVKFGLDGINRLNGMFAFVIYDKEMKKLYAFRDRLGIKPLYYFWDSKRLAISSEIKALIESDIVAPEIDYIALGQYVMLGSVQSPRTITKSVYTLMPGHYLVLDKCNLEIKEYWHPPFVVEDEKNSETFEDAVIRTRELLESAIRYQLVADVPLGVFLSGGIDSSLLVGLMAKIGCSFINTFSMGFEGAGFKYNETHFARTIADKYHTNHHEINLNANDIVREIPNFIRFLDQPSNDGLNTFIISRYARDHVKVCLSGLGGDEVFSGYGWVKFFHAVSSIKKRFSYSVPLQTAYLRSLYESMPYKLRISKIARIIFGIAGAWPRPFDMYNLFHMKFSSSEISKLLLNGDRIEESYYQEPFDLTGDLSPVDAGCFLDLFIYLNNTLLRDVDVLSMAHGLEVRVPFLDHRLVEYVIRLKSSIRYHSKHPKYLLIKAAEGILPSDLIHRRKMGFTLPFGLWFKTPEFENIILDCFSSNGLKGRKIFNNTFLDKLIKIGISENPLGKRPFLQHMVWQFVVLELWLREFLNQNNNSHKIKYELSAVKQ